MTKTRLNLKKIRRFIHYDSSKRTLWVLIWLPSFCTASRRARAFLRVNKIGLNIEKVIKKSHINTVDGKYCQYDEGGYTLTAGYMQPKESI